MRSPFPGMDPYLEPHWRDVHTSLVKDARDALNRQLPDDLVASAEERVAIEGDEADERALSPDVRILEPQSSAEADAQPGAFAVAAPLRLLAQVEPLTERFIRVIETGTERLITVIEFVSPTNKRGAGLAEFRAKRGELLAAGVNFVEFDLVREGNWRALLRPHACPARGVSPYRVTVRIPSDPGAVYLYPLSLRERLPSIAIPLRPRDPEVRLDLQELVDLAYVNGRYARRLDYSKPLKWPLAADDAAWAADFLGRGGRADPAK